MRTPGRCPSSSTSAAASVLLVSVASFLSAETTNAFVVPSSSLLVCNNNYLRSSQDSRLYSVWNTYNCGDQDELDVPSPTREASQEYDDQRNGYYSSHEESDIRRNNDDKIRAVGMATALAAGTAMAWNGDVSAAGAVNTMMNKVPTATTTASVNVWQQPAYLLDNNNQRQGPAVSLPYLEEQIRAAEEALYTQQPSMMIADAAATTAPSAPKPAAPAPATAAPKPAATIAATPKPAAPATAVVTPAKPATTPATATVAPAAPKPAESTAAAPATAATTATKPVATTAAPPAAPKLTAATAVAAPAAPKPPATVAATTTPAKPAAPKPATAANSSPSLYRYTKQHWPEWIKASKMAYRTAEPVVMQISKDVTYQLDKNILPEVRKVEHRILGDPVANVVDRAAATVVKAGTVAVGTAGKAVPVVFEVGKQVVQATPKVIQTGKQLYTTLDKQVIPELKKDYKIAKKVVEEKTPQVIRAGKQVYQAGRQLYYAVEEDVLPKVMAAEKNLAPKINALEHRILGDEAADVVDKAVGLTIRSGKTAAKVISKNAPVVFSAAKKTVNGAYQTGKFVVKGGQQVYHFGEEYIPKAYRTTKTVVLAADRTGGQLANAIDKEAPKVIAAVKKEIPKIRETGGRMQRAIEPAVVQLAESGKAITADVVTLVEKQIEGNEEAASVVAVGAAATAIATAATSEDSFLVDTYGRSGTSISGSSGGFPSLFSRSRGGYTELSRRRF